MAEEDVIAYPLQPSENKRKLRTVESNVLEQNDGSIDLSNKVSVDDANEAPDYSQAKRPKLDGEAADGLGIGETIESKEESGEESKEEGTGNPQIEKVEEPIHAEESENKMEDNGEPEDNQPAFVEATTTPEVSVEESKEVNTSGSQNEADDTNKGTSDALAWKDVENEIKDVDDGGSQKGDDNESKEANAGGRQEKTGDESKEVNASEEIGDGSKEVNGGSSHKEVDGTQSTTRHIGVPSSKVGMLIGKGGEMVRNLQLSSGAKIQIRRDAEADPNSSLRPVEIIGNLASVEKAEKLINELIAQTEAGGVPAVFAKGISEQMEITVPNDKVGMIIGRGGETIKNMQTKSRARIQLIPHEEGDGCNERTVRISGDKRQIDIATALIKDVMYQMWLLPFSWGQHCLVGVQ